MMMMPSQLMGNILKTLDNILAMLAEAVLLKGVSNSEKQIDFYLEKTGQFIFFFLTVSKGIVLISVIVTHLSSSMCFTEEVFMQSNSSSVLS